MNPNNQQQKEEPNSTQGQQVGQFEQPAQALPRSLRANLPQLPPAGQRNLPMEMVHAQWQTGILVMCIRDMVPALPHRPMFHRKLMELSQLYAYFWQLTDKRMYRPMQRVPSSPTRSVNINPFRTQAANRRHLATIASHVSYLPQGPRLAQRHLPMQMMYAQIQTSKLILCIENMYAYLPTRSIFHQKLMQLTQLRELLQQLTDIGLTRRRQPRRA